MLREHRRTAILIITVLAALFAPPDAVSMLILGIPLVFFYEAAIWVVHSIEVNRIKNNPSAQSDPEPPSPLEGKSRP
jgi:sec-independent protein translocase protein TatC